MKLHCYLLLLLAGSTLRASSINVFDGVFKDTNWTSAILTSTNNAAGNTFDAHQELLNGNPLEFRYLTHTTTKDGSGLYNTIRIQNLYSLFSIDPSLTAIQSMDMSVDLIYYPNNLNSFNTMAYELAISQAGNTYLSSASVFSDTPTWGAHSLSALVQSSFCLAKLNANPLNCSANPNFSGGGMIQIGYAITNGLPHAAVYGAQKSGLDNFNVTITTDAVPEPASIGLAAIGLALAGWRGYRMRR